MIMKKKVSGFHSLAICTLMLACTATFAAIHPPQNGYKNEGSQVATHTPGYFEVIGAGSLSKVHANNGQLGITSDEIDTLVQTNDDAWNSWGGQLGIGYVYFISNAQQYSKHVQWFPMIEPQLNVYYSNYHNKGDVYRFGDPAFNELSYDMPIHSTRLMLDGALTVASWRKFSTYIKAGIGNSWNRIAYSDVDHSDDTCVIQNLKLNDNDNSHFVWEAGAGATYAFNNRVGLSFEYLYADFGKLKTAGNGNTGLITAPLILPASFNLHTQALLLGLHVSI